MKGGKTRKNKHLKKNPGSKVESETTPKRKTLESKNEAKEFKRNKPTKKNPKKNKLINIISSVPSDSNVEDSRNQLIIGKVTAEWCGHCQSLQPKWDTMENEIINECSPMSESNNDFYLDNRNNKIQFYKIDSNNQEDPIRKINDTYLLNSNEKLTVNGYPTIFKINGNQLQYYQGEREPEPMKQWFFMKNATTTGGKKRK